MEKSGKMKVKKKWPPCSTKPFPLGTPCILVCKPLERGKLCPIRFAYGSFYAIESGLPTVSQELYTVE